MDRGFEGLSVWRDSKALAVSIYRGARRPPLNQDRSLRDQMQRAAISISSNIAEGFERESVRDQIRFLIMAKGSAAELRSQILVGTEIGVIGQEDGKTWALEARKVAASIANLMKFKKRVLLSGETHLRANQP
jgi:four helix bundle protein